MYNLLVVDDEEIAVKGIVYGIDWSDTPFSQVLFAYDAMEAKELLENETIHILLSDIDMPELNGIRLLEWVKEHSPHTETIFLTGHADFRYAQQALHLNSFDYLLKPIDHQELKATLGKALQKIQASEQIQEIHKDYELFLGQWQKQLPILRERFWQDAVNLRVPVNSAYLASAYETYGIPLAADDSVRLVLLSVEHWNDVLTARDEEIMSYAIRNAGEEIVLLDGMGQFVQETGGILYAVVYPQADEHPEALGERCREFISLCRTYLKCEVSCYIGNPVGVSELHCALGELTAMERNYLARGGAVLTIADYKPETTAVTGVWPSLEDWAVLLDLGKRDELLERLAVTMRRLESSQVDSSTLEGLYHGLVYLVFQALQKKGKPMGELYADDEWRDNAAAAKSIARLQDWATRFLGRAADYFWQSKELSPFVQKALQYIDSHLHLDFSREDIAGYVYLNPAYLSRLFKRETGKSITDYMLEARVAGARTLLETTNLKISDIAIQVGYDNFSHFTKIFKKLTGVAPMEYRKTYQHIEK